MVTALAAVPVPAENTVLVRCWFGTHAIGTYVGPAAQAARVGEGWLRRFPGLPVTSKVITGLPDTVNAPTGVPGSDSSR